VSDDTIVCEYTGDPTKYFFKKADIEKWTKTELGSTAAAGAAVKTLGAGPSTATPGSPSKKNNNKPQAKSGRMTTNPSAPATGSTKAEDAEAEKVIQEIETLLPLIPLSGLKSIRVDIRRMAGA
jgi:hypothetical protein